MNPGIVFTEKYLKLMFNQLRDATPEEVMDELEHCRRENRRPVRVSRYFSGFFIEEKFTASTGFEMQIFKHEEAARPLNAEILSSGVSCTTLPYARIMTLCSPSIPSHQNTTVSIQSKHCWNTIKTSLNQKNMTKFISLAIRQELVFVSW